VRVLWHQLMRRLVLRKRMLLNRPEHPTPRRQGGDPGAVTADGFQVYRWLMACRRCYLRRWRPDLACLDRLAGRLQPITTKRK